MSSASASPPDTATATAPPAPAAATATAPPTTAPDSAIALATAQPDPATVQPTTKADWTSDQEPRWCPGCGDYSVLTAVQLLMPELGARMENTVFVSGIGCAARFPYYMNTYGLHTIHGRAPAIATGLAMARPDLDVWVIGGDGDLLSIGGNHLIHALRRNINLKILLFNNQIYGLTKGQYSPTSEVGKVSKSSPLGSLEEPFNAVSLALAAEATFVARTHDMDRAHMQEMFRRAYEHHGVAFVEIYQNCNVFNDGAFDLITKKDRRPSMLIELRHGEPIRFGEDLENGVVLGGAGSGGAGSGGEGRGGAGSGSHDIVRVAKVADVGEDALLVHNEQLVNPTLALALSRLASGPFMPTPMGVFRAVERQEYAEEVSRQLAYSQDLKRAPGDLDALLHSRATWEVA